MYKNTIQKIREYDFQDINNRDYQYLLWMCDEIEKMTDSLKAARWMGYVLRMVEELDFWDNSISRDYIREDVTNGNQ